MTGWHIITSEYPPDVGGVSDYTHQVAETLASDGAEVHVWCSASSGPRPVSRVHVHNTAGRFSPSDLTRVAQALDTFPSPRRLLVQWVPHGYGYRSMNLWFCLWLAGRAARGDRLELMVHEPFIELKRGPLRHVATAIVHRLMTMVLMRSVARVWVAIPAWESLLRPYALGRRVRIEWLPIPACIAVSQQLEAESEQGPADRRHPLVGHFGSYGKDISTLLLERLPAVMASPSHPSLLLIGVRSETFRAVLLERYPTWSARVRATGHVDATELAAHIQSCDVLLQPYPDGISSRRTTAMACLALGRPVVTTSGHLTEPLWAERGAVVLARVSDPDSFAFAAARLLDDPDERRRVGASGLRLYHERFDLARTVSALAS